MTYWTNDPDQTPPAPVRLVRIRGVGWGGLALWYLAVCAAWYWLACWLTGV